MARAAGQRPGLRVAVTGASGFVGSALVPFLRAQGHEVVRITRSAAPAADAVHWDPVRQLLDPATLTGVDAAVHLAGVAIDERWTASHKRAILSSRVDGTMLLARTLAALSPAPRVLVSASAIGIYGNRGDERLDETSTMGTGFLADVCRAWEEAAAPARDVGIRTVPVRFGVVLGRGGGALARLVPPFELGAGGKIGDGTQWMSWVARDDLVAILLFLLTADTVHEPVNATTANPVTNADFAKTLAHVLHRPALATIPAFALRLLYGELADAALLASQRVYPRALTGAGFSFRFPTLEAALEHELGQRQSL